MTRDAHRRKAADEYGQALAALRRAWAHDRKADDFNALDQSLICQEKYNSAERLIQDLQAKARSTKPGTGWRVGNA
jgi:hypothetical protein